MQLIDRPGEVDGEISFRSRKNDEIVDIGKLNPKGKKVREIRGGEISMILGTNGSLLPIHTIGNQIIEGILLHITKDKDEARKLAIETLKQVGISNPEQRIDQYPHELSGGMRQRAMIAMALCCNPAILIADEPTTALDVTIQAQVLDLINNLKEKSGSAVIFITHDLGVIAEMSDDVVLCILEELLNILMLIRCFSERFIHTPRDYCGLCLRLD